MKGETTGHVLAVEAILVDCDQDALVLKVRPAGPACHTGARSCFYRALEGESLTRIGRLSRANRPAHDQLHAPLRDVRFILDRLLDLGIDEDLVEAILGEAGRFAAEVIAPLNQPGDRAGCTRHPDGSVTTPPGYAEAYAQYREAGWGTLALPEEHGGQGLPHVLATVVEEFLNSACHAFNMYPGLDAWGGRRADGEGQRGAQGDLPAPAGFGRMARHDGADRGAGRDRPRPDPHASRASSRRQLRRDRREDLLLGRRARPDREHRPPRAGQAARRARRLARDLAVRGAEGPARRQRATRSSCGSIEHKMGVHGSATCVMNFDGATGWLVGEENGGLAAMFIMMNAARLSCGNQGLAQAELAYQNAAAYALRARSRAGRRAARPKRPTRWSSIPTCGAC